jgi:hypothetical protein
VFTRGRNGTNLKAHTVPVNQRTPYQNNVRTALALAQYSYRQLNSSDLYGWQVWAASLTWTNNLGQTYSPTGQQLYTQAYTNAVRFQAAPASPTPIAVPIPQPITSLQISGGGTELTVLAYNGSDPYEGSWLMYMTPPQTVSKTVTKTVRKRYIGGAFETYAIEGYNGFLAAWGVTAPITSYVGVRAVPINYPFFIAGTPYEVTQEVE